MKNVISLSVVASVLLFSTQVLASERYLCETSKGNGFRYNQTLSRWMQKSFESDAKYLLTQTGEASYQLEKTGSQDEYQCNAVENLREELENTRWVKCETADHLKGFMFNATSKRFVWQSMGDYLYQPIGTNPSASQGDVVTFIGKCSTL